MSSGPWIPLSKELVCELPKDRSYTRLEAMFSLTVDYDNGKPVTVKGYADLWGWSRGKVERFIKDIGVLITYPKDTNEKQNQRGQISIQIPGRLRADDRQTKMIDSKCLSEETSIKRADDEHKAGRSQGTTIYPKPKPNKKTIPAKNPPADFILFRDWWMYAFGVVEGDAYIFQGGKDGACLSLMLKIVDWKELVCKACHYLVDTNRFPPGRPAEIQ